MNPVAYGSYLDQMVGKVSMARSSTGSSAKSFCPKKESMIMAMKRFRKTCETTI